jgi:hypothetical protein
MTEASHRQHLFNGVVEVLGGFCFLTVNCGDSGASNLIQVHRLGRLKCKMVAIHSAAPRVQ